MSRFDGSYHHCAFCGERFYIDNPGYYVYKKPASTKGSASMIYFCGWNCMRGFEKKKEEEKQKRRYTNLCKRVR